MWPRNLPDETNSVEESEETLVRQLISRAPASQRLPSHVRESLEEFGKAIRALRNSRGLSRVALARKAGLHAAFISLLENGEVLKEELFPEVVESIANALGMSSFMLDAMLPELDDSYEREVPALLPMAASEASGKVAEEQIQAEPTLIPVPEAELEITGTHGSGQFQVWMDSEGNVFLRPGAEPGATHLLIHNERYPIDSRVIKNQETIVVSGLDVTQLLDLLEAEDEGMPLIRFSSEIS